MKTAFTLFVLLTSTYFSIAQTDDEKVRQLERRLEQIEERMSNLEKQVYGPVGKNRTEASPAAKKMMEEARKRVDADRKKFPDTDIRKAEALYQSAMPDYTSDSSQRILESVVSTYPQLNRAGCARLYLARAAEGPEQERLLKDCITRFFDCYYLDGVQVGPFAMFHLWKYYMSSGNKSEAENLLQKIRKDHPDAVDHKGRLLSELIGRD